LAPPPSLVRRIFLSNLLRYLAPQVSSNWSTRKGGPGITRSDLLVINKIDLAPYVGANLEVMESDARRMRKGGPFVFTNLMTLEGLDSVTGWIKKYALLEKAEEPKLLR